MTSAAKQLLSPGRALELVLERVRPLPAEPVALPDALGRVLASGIASADDVPGFDNSAMDGFAVRSADIREARADRPVTLRLRGESRAGRPASVALEGADAIRISTGAMVPEGADAVVRKEDAREHGESVEILEAATPGKEIRRAGEDIAAEETVLEAGTVLGPAELGVIASVGVSEVSCAQRPRVVVLTTGDELVEPGTPLGPGQIRNSNYYAVSAQAGQAGAHVVDAQVVPDSYETTVNAIAAGLKYDVLIVCGGVSVGEHDHVKQAFAELGAEEVFWGLALRPGHPTWFGVGPAHEDERDRTLVFGLPGNPVSAMITFHLFARPALLALMRTDARPRRATAVMDEPYAKRPGRAHVVRCRLEQRQDGWHVRPTKAQGSHVLTSMLDAEALALLDVERGDVVPGERVEIELL